MAAKAAYIVGSAIIVFLPGDGSHQDREDVCNSIEFAERATRKKFPNPADIKDWENAFFGSLSALHWFFESTQTEAKNVLVDKLLGAMQLSLEDKKCVHDVLDSLTSSRKNVDALKVFNDRMIVEPPPTSAAPADSAEQTSADGSELHTRYQVILCSTKNGAVEAQFTSCQYVGLSFISDCLFAQFPRHAEIRISSRVYGLNFATYAGDRDKIKQKLEEAGNSTQREIHA